MTQGVQRYVCDTLGGYAAVVLLVEYGEKRFCPIIRAFQQYSVRADFQHGVICKFVSAAWPVPLYFCLVWENLKRSMDIQAHRVDHVNSFVSQGWGHSSCSVVISSSMRGKNTSNTVVVIRPARHQRKKKETKGMTGQVKSGGRPLCPAGGDAHETLFCASTAVSTSVGVFFV